MFTSDYVDQCLYCILEGSKMLATISGVPKGGTTPPPTHTHGSWLQLPQGSPHYNIIHFPLVFLLIFMPQSGELPIYLYLVSQSSVYSYLQYKNDSECTT